MGNPNMGNPNMGNPNLAHIIEAHINLGNVMIWATLIWATPIRANLIEKKNHSVLTFQKFSAKSLYTDFFSSPERVPAVVAAALYADFFYTDLFFRLFKTVFYTDSFLEKVSTEILTFSKKKIQYKKLTEQKIDIKNKKVPDVVDVVAAADVARPD